MRYANTAIARAEFAKHRPWFEARGVIFQGAKAYVSDEVRGDYRRANDAAPTTVTDPNSSIPALLTTYIDPEVYDVIFAPNMAAAFYGEEREGDWLRETAMFPVQESTGEISSYGDFNDEGGRAGLNTNWPQFQSYLWQSIIQYGDREVERMGLARIGWVAGLQRSTAVIHAKFGNFVYLFGVAGLQNYGLINNPYLSAPLTPALKANGGVTWFTSGSSPNATANEVYNDILALFAQLVAQNQGNLTKDSRMKLAMSPGSAVALGFTNSFGVNVEDLLKKNFKNLEVVQIPQFGAVSATDPQGVAGGNLLQLKVDEVQGQRTGFCAFNEKMRAHRLVPGLSSFRQKTTGAAWGTILRYPAGVAQMLGV